MRKTYLLLASLCILSVCYTVFIGLNKISNQSSINQDGYEGVLVVWNIDTFEGGYGSRKEFLGIVAKEFERQNPSVLVLISNHTAQSVKQNLQDGKRPDVISYGAGVEINGILAIETNLSFENSTLNNKVFALPWCRGNYFLISHSGNVNALDNPNENRLIVSSNTYTQPLTALVLEGVYVQNVESCQPLDAYVKFVSDKKSVLLGTQRDIVRLTNRGLDYEYKILTNFSDIYQYVSITSQSDFMSVYSQRFIDILMSESIQKRLSEISMCSNYYKVEHQIPALNEMQKNSVKYTFSPLVSGKIIYEMQELSVLAVKGDGVALDKLKNMVDMP